MRWISVGAALGFLAVALGAFGAHALEARLSAKLLATWKTAVEYQMYHALALIAVGALTLPDRVRAAAGGLFLAGVVLFSGSLYALVITEIRTFGAITPIGGTCFLGGWLALAAGGLKR